MGDGSHPGLKRAPEPGGAIVEAASQRVTLGEVLARRRPPIASPSRRRMPEPNTSDRNSHGSRVHEISDRKIAARFFGRLPTTRCGEEDRRLLRFSKGFWFLRSRSITHADRDGGRKLARLRGGFAAENEANVRLRSINTCYDCRGLSIGR